jgi:hypothetical protein
MTTFIMIVFELFIFGFDLDEPEYNRVYGAFQGVARQILIKEWARA